MNCLPPESIALRQLIIVGLLAFLAGLAGTLVLIGWLMWRFVEPDTPWDQLLHIAIYGLIFSVLGGMALAAGATSLLSWWHYRRGMHRCTYCGRPLKGIAIRCDCPEVTALQNDDQRLHPSEEAREVSGWSRYGKVLRWLASGSGLSDLPPEAQRAAWTLAAQTHAVILLITMVLIAVNSTMSPSLHSVTILHFLLGLLTAKVVEIISGARELLKRPPLWLVSSGWLSAFSYTLVPLFGVALVSWLLD